MVGDVGVGGDNPIRLQSMTTTRTLDTAGTVAQAERLVRAGCEIVRITAPTVEDAKNLKNIRRELLARGVRVPIVADIHFLPAAAMEAAEHVEKVRVNPGNYVDSKTFKVMEYTDEAYRKELERIEERFTPLVLKLKKLGRALRIGTNHGSLSDRIMNRYGDTPEGMVESALEFVRVCEKNGFRDIILSMKSSNPKVMIAAYRLLAARMEESGMDYPFHLGVTEAGDGEDGRIKSAIGIGSLLEDGIGDTIRVSLTEEPELEIPVCRRIAGLYGSASGRPAGGAEVLPPHAEDLFRYSRRAAKEVAVGPFRLGGENPVRVVTDLRSHTGRGILELLEAQLKNTKSVPPEIVEWAVSDREDLERLSSCRRSLAGETSRLAFLARFDDRLDLAPEGLKLADCALFKYRPGDDAPTRRSKFTKFLALARERKIPVMLEAGPCDGRLTPSANMLNGIQWALESGVRDLILSFNLPDRPGFIHNVRALAARLKARGAEYPIHLRFQSRGPRDFDDHRVQASIALGSLLCDGIGDSVQAGAGLDPRADLDLIYNILQAAGTRVSKAEYVSCPSCGRTLFDLQTTTDRIRKKTGHLKGVKIAIMGCIVNGPGEMADADFGYVGGAPGKINLYVGKECVRKNVPAEISDEELIRLIQARGKWREPEPD
ncbi:MAG: hypothetical protein A2636_04865 [Elusimicrobia bacterium RIFCSPHIGHO2_01_FULL_64_10]|nr:MAG: hypothetical protein A2636_04865 [Elusimicrobia bacterium RIFCSPHIGHO2_01_FULL_64_10]